MYWMGDRKCKKIQSFGGVYHFKKEQQPEGASDRCFTCKVEEKCPYSVQKIYLSHGKYQMINKYVSLILVHYRECQTEMANGSCL